jgi:hypothetical protein
MADEAPKKPKLEVVRDAQDIEALWLDPGLGDGITDTHWHQIPIGKPKNFFRVHPDKMFRRKTEIYVHKPEDAIEEQYYCSFNARPNSGSTPLYPRRVHRP